MDSKTALWVGAGAMVVSAPLFWWSRRSARRLLTIQETPTIACRDLPGLGAVTVEVVGAARADQPLIADLSGKQCVAFSSSIVEHWTTRHTERDSKGRKRTVTRHHSAVRYSNEKRQPFDVVDASGAARVEPDGAEIDLISGDAGPAYSGSPAFGITARHWNGRLAYHEALLPVETEVYVLASVSERHTLVKPTTLGDPFIISHRSEDSLLSGARWSWRIATGLAVLLFVGGAVLIGYALGDAPSPIKLR